MMELCASLSTDSVVFATRSSIYLSQVVSKYMDGRDLSDKVKRVGSVTFCYHFIQNIFQNWLSSMNLRNRIIRL